MNIIGVVFLEFSYRLAIETEGDSK